MPFQTSASSSHRGSLESSHGVIHMSSMRPDVSILCSALSSRGSAIRMGMGQLGDAAFLRMSQYWLYFLMAWRSTGLRLLMPFWVVWWSFVPNVIQTYKQKKRVNSPRGRWWPPTARSRHSHSKKLPTAFLCMIILRSRARSDVCMKVRLIPWSSGNLPMMSMEVYNLSTWVFRMTWVFSRPVMRFLEDFVCVESYIAVLAFCMDLWIVSISDCRVRIFPSSCLRHAGVSVAVEGWGERQSRSKTYMHE